MFAPSLKTVVYTRYRGTSAFLPCPSDAAESMIQDSIMGSETAEHHYRSTINEDLVHSFI